MSYFDLILGAGKVMYDMQEVNNRSCELKSRVWPRLMQQKRGVRLHHSVHGLPRLQLQVQEESRFYLTVTPRQGGN